MYIKTEADPAGTQRRMVFDLLLHGLNDHDSYVRVQASSDFAPCVTRLLDLARDIRGGYVRFRSKDLLYGVPETLDVTWSADSPRSSLGRVVAMLNGGSLRSS